MKNEKREQIKQNMLSNQITLSELLKVFGTLFSEWVEFLANFSHIYVQILSIIFFSDITPATTF